MTLTNKILLVCTIIILLIAVAITAILTAFPIRHAEIIERHAQINNLEPAFVAAVIHAESKFRPLAVSRADARGLMQITPPTGEWLAEHLRLEGFTTEHLFDIETNIKIGSYYLRRLLDQHNQDVRVALAAYNAGTGNVRRWLNDSQFSPDGTTLAYIPFGETRTYIERVLFNQRIYAILYSFRDSFSGLRG